MLLGGIERELFSIWKEHWVVKGLTLSFSEHVYYDCVYIILRNFKKFTGKHLCRSLFFNKIGSFIGSIPQRWRFGYVFRKFENKIFFAFWLDWEPYRNNQYKKKEYNQQSSIFKDFKNNDPKLRKITFILFECHISIDKSTDFYFLLLSWKSSL